MARTNKPKIKEATPQIKPSGPFGPWMKNPPLSCKYKRKDSKGLWVENVTCAFVCVDTKCECYIELMKEHKLRTKG